MKIISLIFSIAALVGWMFISFSKDINTSNEALNVVISLLDIMLLISLILIVLVKVFNTVGLKYNGILFGIISSTLISAVTAIKMFATLPTTSFDDQIALSFVFIYGIIAFILFKSGFRIIKTVHAEQLFFFGKRLDGKELKEGAGWWIPEIFFGTTKSFNMQNNFLELYKNEGLTDPKTGISFEKSPIAIRYKLMEGKLSKTMQLSSNVDEELAKIFKERIRTMFILVGDSIDKKEVTEKYKGLSLLSIISLVKLLERLILNGPYFTSHFLFPQLKRDSLYIKKVCDAYKELHSKRNVARTSQENMLNWFTPEQAKSSKLNVFTDEQWAILLSNRSIYSLPEQGIYEKSAEIGIEILEITMDTFTLPASLATVSFGESRKSLFFSSRNFTVTLVMEFVPGAVESEEML